MAKTILEKAQQALEEAESANIDEFNLGTREAKNLEYARTYALVAIAKQLEALNKWGLDVRTPEM